MGLSSVLYLNVYDIMIPLSPYMNIKRKNVSPASGVEKRPLSSTKTTIMVTMALKL